MRANLGNWCNKIIITNLVCVTKYMTLYGTVIKAFNIDRGVLT